METGQLWARCRAGDTEARARLIERYAALATSVARRMPVPLGALIDRDDVESAGLVGLIDAVDRFDPERGVPFEAYATVRIRGAILDEIRSIDHLGRADRRRERAVAASDPASLALVAYAATLSLDLLLEDGHPLADGDEPGAHHDEDDLRARVNSALALLSPRQRELIARYYGESLSLRESGERMGISEARACQLHGRAIEILRRQLSVFVAPRGVRPAAS